MSGAEITSSNDDASFAKTNRKQWLIDSGTNIQAATKQGAGQQSYCTSTGSGLHKAGFYQTDPGNVLWGPTLAELLWSNKYGFFFPISTTYAENVSGFLRSAATTGTPTMGTFSTSYGTCVTWTTGASAGNTAGANVAQRFTIRDHNPTFKWSFRINSLISNTRLFIGWTSDTSVIPNNDDPLNTANGVALFRDTTLTNFRIIHNDNSGATSSDDTGIAADTGTHTITVWADAGNNKFWWSLDGSAATGITTDIPGATAQMSFQAILMTTTGSAKNIDWFKGLITTDAVNI